ncbi:MAG: PPC domain-containing protein [Planctomycetales bacterium]|nr:PPC domain-containing protein [Planctomycetales bacterium]
MKRQTDASTLRLSALLFLALFVCNSSKALAAPPNLTFLYPAGGQRGTKVNTMCNGTFEWPAQVWASGLQATCLKDKGQIEIALPADFDNDRVWVRLFNDEGASTAVPFLVNSLNSVAEAEPNDETISPQALTDQQTIDGKLDKMGDVDCFSVEMKSGETLVAALEANTAFGSPMDAVLQIVTPDGIVLSENHDAVGLDPRVVFHAKSDGTYIVRLFAFAANPNTRIEHHGGDNYTYRLTITNGPFITRSAQLAARNGTAKVQPVGWNLDDQLVTLQPIGAKYSPMSREYEDVDQRLRVGSTLGFAFQDGAGGFAKPRLVEHEVIEVTPGQQLVLPVTTHGTIGSQKQVNEYKLSLKKDDQIVIGVESIGLHLPLVPLVRLFDSEAKAVAEVLETGPARDVVLQHDVKQDGEYTLTIADRYQNGGKRFWYRLTARHLQTSFELSTSTDSVVVDSAKPTEVEITVARMSGSQGKLGDIKISASGLPEGVTCDPVVSAAEGDSSKKVKLAFATTGSIQFSGPIQIVGTASEPESLSVNCLTPARFETRRDEIWLTAKKSAENSEQ